MPTYVAPRKSSESPTKKKLDSYESVVLDSESEELSVDAERN